MVDYPDFSNFGNDTNIGDLLSLPNTSYPYFWVWILFGIWTIITLGLYFSEKNEVGKRNILSSMSVASFCIIILSTLGTIVGFVTNDIFIPLLVLCFLIIGIWFFFGRSR
jgi:hypothetical protein